MLSSLASTSLQYSMSLRQPNSAQHNRQRSDFLHYNGRHSTDRVRRSRTMDHSRSPQTSLTTTSPTSVTQSSPQNHANDNRPGSTIGENRSQSSSTQPCTTIIAPASTENRPRSTLSSGPSPSASRGHEIILAYSPSLRQEESIETTNNATLSVGGILQGPPLTLLPHTTNINATSSVGGILQGSPLGPLPHHYHHRQNRRRHYRVTTITTSSSSTTTNACRAVDKLKACCNSTSCLRCLTVITTYRWVMIALAALGLLCVTAGIAMGALFMVLGNSNYLVLCLTFIGAGVLLVIAVSVVWCCTPSGHEPCHLLFKLGNFSVVGHPQETPPQANRRQQDSGIWHTTSALANPEFQHRPNPPSYSTVLRELQQQQHHHLQISDYDELPNYTHAPPSQSRTICPPQCSPPPPYRSNSGTLERGTSATTFLSSRPNLPLLFRSPGSRPPSYRANAGGALAATLERPPMPREVLEPSDPITGGVLVPDGYDNLACDAEVEEIINGRWHGHDLPFSGMPPLIGAVVVPMIVNERQPAGMPLAENHQRILRSDEGVYDMPAQVCQLNVTNNDGTSLACTSDATSDPRATSVLRYLDNILEENLQEVLADGTTQDHRDTRTDPRAARCLTSTPSTSSGRHEGIYDNWRGRRWVPQKGTNRLSASLPPQKCRSKSFPSRHAESRMTSESFSVPEKNEKGTARGTKQRHGVVDDKA